MDIRLCTLANEFDRSTDLGGRDGLELLPTMTVQFNVKLVTLSLLPTI
jgi:hypothetical protein